MENIFIEITTQNYFFDQKLNIKTNVLNYLFNNLDIENNNTLSWDLTNALTINANGEYIH